jgi:hypothetical protein
MIFSSPPRPDRLWGPPSLSTNGYHGLLLWGQSGQGMKLTTHLHLVSRLRIRGATLPLPQYAFMAWCSVKKSTTWPLLLPFIGLLRSYFCSFIQVTWVRVHTINLSEICLKIFLCVTQALASVGEVFIECEVPFWFILHRIITNTVKQSYCLR